MFGLGKKSKKSSDQKRYEQLLKQAMDAQRGGDIVRCSELTAEADALYATLKARDEDPAQK